MPFTTTYRAGDVVLVAFPFTTGTPVKRRPALVILDTGDEDLVLARITTRVLTSPHDVAVADWQAAGLIASSVIRLHKLATLRRRLISRRLGALGAADRQRVAAVLRQTYGTWA